MASYFVDPSIDAASGAGTIGDPYGDLQHCLDTITQCGTNDFDQINIKAGTDEVLTAAIDLTTYGTPAWNQYLLFKGYTSAENDGGIGQISGNALYSIFSSTAIDYVMWVDLECHNSGSNPLFVIDDSHLFYGCELHNTSGDGIDSNVGQYSSVVGCNFHNIGGIGTKKVHHVSDSYFANGTNDFSTAIHQVGPGGCIQRNIISIDGASNGIFIDLWRSIVRNNSILCSSGTGKGIYITSDQDISGSQIYGNIVEGFSGAGGNGFDWSSTAYGFPVYQNNAAYNNTTDYANAPTKAVIESDNETLLASGFDKSGSDTFANRYTYFNPVDTGNIHGGAGNNLDKGAVQHTETGGGSASGVRNPLVGPIG